MPVRLLHGGRTRSYKRIIGDLDRVKEVPAYDVDLAYIPPVKRIVTLATKIDKEQRRLSKVIPPAQ